MTQKKQTIAAVLALFALCLASFVYAEPGDSAFDVLPQPQVNPESDFGTDVNVNMETIDQYLGLTDAVYRDMRMLVDPYDYDAIGGSSIASAMIEGFTLVPYPLLAPCQNMPEELGAGYEGPTLFSLEEDGRYRANYAESMDILTRLFPRDHAIILMCGAGGYAGMTKNLLLSLGWDEGMIINAGGYWFYRGDHAVKIASPDSGDGLYVFTGAPIVSIDFTHLTPLP